MSFHYYLSSTSSLETYPDNVGGKFRNNLVNMLNLEGEWEVGLESIMCKPYNYTNLDVTDENISMATLDPMNSSEKINGWKTYSEIKSIEGEFILTPNMKGEYYIDLYGKPEESNIYFRSSFFSRIDGVCYRAADIMYACNESQSRILWHFLPSRKHFVSFSSDKVTINTPYGYAPGDNKTLWVLHFSQGIVDILGIDKIADHNTAVNTNNGLKLLIQHPHASFPINVLLNPIKEDVRTDYLTKYVMSDTSKFMNMATSKILVTNLTTIDNLVDRVNLKLVELQRQLGDVLKDAAQAKFTVNTNNYMVYEQPELCELYLSPRIFRLFGIVSPKPVVTTQTLVGTYTPSMNKFLQTMWIYTSIIQPQYVGDQLAHLLRIIPVLEHGPGKLIGIHYDNPIYVKLTHNNITEIDILITNSLCEYPVNFGDDKVILGLLFRKCIT